MVPVRLTYSIADQSFAQTKSLGILRLSLELLRHLATRPEIASMAVLANSTLAADLKLPPRVAVQMHDEAVRGRWRRIWWDQRRVYAAAQKLGNDWLLLPKGFASSLGPCPVKLATYVHDVMADYYRANYRSQISVAENAYFRRALRSSLRHSRVILTNSVFTASEIARVASENGMRPPPIRPVGIGFASSKVLPGGSRDAIVALASPLPHKRSDLAASYLDRWQGLTGFAGSLHWVGRFPNGVAPPCRANWVFHSRLNDAEYERLLTGARAVVYVSEYEGFGMPPVEAALAGACPVFSDIAATREVMAGAGCPFANGDFDSFAAALNAALRVSEAQLRNWAAELSQRHDWESVGARVVQALQGAT